MKNLIALTLTLASVAYVQAAGPRTVCGPNGCYIVPDSYVVAQAAPAKPKYAWLPTQHGGQVDLYANGKEVGRYWFATDTYHAWDGSKFTTATKPPIAPPSVPLLWYEGEQKGMFFGADDSKRSKKDRITINGFEATMADAKAIIGGPGGTLEDDSKKKHLTAIGPDAASKQRFEAFLKSPAAADMVKDCRVQVYDASRKVDQAMLAVFKLDADPKFIPGKGVLILQDPEQNGRARGKVIAYGDADDAAMTTALRKADPLWNAPKVPVPTPGPGPNQPETPIPPLVIFGAAAAGLYLLSKKRAP